MSRATMGQPRAILFDLDGTLTDREASLREAAGRLLADFDSLGSRGPEDVAQALIDADDNGMRPKLDVMARLVANLQWLDPPPADVLVGWWQDNFGACTRPAAGLATVMSACEEAGVQLGLVSNGGPIQHQKVRVLGLERRFAVTLISADIGIRKPDPRIFRMALVGVRCRPEETWFVGDNADADIAGAQAVGVAGVWVSGGRGWPEALARPRASVSSLDEVAGLL